MSGGPARWKGYGKRSVQADETEAPPEAVVEEAPPPAPEPEPEPEPTPEPEPEPEPAPEPEPTPEPEPGPDEITEAAKALAAMNNIDIATVPGTGLDGRVTKEDVELVIQQQQAQAQLTESS